jgi:hypothetical protein
VYVYKKEGEYIQKVRAFKLFVDYCKKNNIQLIIAIPPNFRKTTIGFPERMEELLEGYGTVKNFDSTKPEYTDSDYFFDDTHLQTNGSIVYTNEIIDYYKKLNNIK